jgi:flagellum-specific ATP synthase
MMTGTADSRVADQLRRYLGDCGVAAAAAAPFAHCGRLTRVAGLVMEAVGLRLPVGASVLVDRGEDTPVDAEVVGFAGEQVYLMPASELHGLTPGAAVRPIYAPPLPPRFGTPAAREHAAGMLHAKLMPVGDALLGRVVDAAGRPLDGAGALACEARAPLAARVANPIERDPIRSTLDVGVRAINALVTVGRGQRLGLFAGSGVGKSVLLGMMARYTSADVTVVGLVGERGREVKEFIESSLGAAGRARSVVVAAPADAAPLMRLQGAAYATAIAEHFRDRGRNVLLLMDSLTRYAMAAREVALAIGEPPATKGYPPSVFARLPQLVERAGNGPVGGGSITAFYTVLTEGDDLQDPIADSARAILDGHVVLSRALAEAGHFPAIDIDASVSRVMHSVVPAAALAAAREFRRLASRYNRNRDLIAVGAYSPGADPLLDRAIALHEPMTAFLQQDMDRRATLGESQTALVAALGHHEPATARSHAT